MDKRRVGGTSATLAGAARAAVAAALMVGLAASVCAPAEAGTPARSATFRVGLTLLGSCNVSVLPAEAGRGRVTSSPGVTCTVPRPHVVSAGSEPVDAVAASLLQPDTAGGKPARIGVVTVSF